MTQELTGKVAAVTGSSSGIGQAIALAMADAGADVIVHAARNTEGAERTAAAIRELGREATVLMCDFSAGAAALGDFADEAWRWKSTCDIWINNAGADVLTGNRSELPFLEKLRLLLEVDVTATIVLSRHIAAMMPQGSAIVNIGWDQSMLGMEGDSGELFAATKGAIMAFTRSLAKSLSPKVRVNCIAAGWIKTAWGEQASDLWQQRAVQESLMRRWGTPEDIAAATRFLVSPAASFITGQIVPVNGGRSS